MFDIHSHIIYGVDDGARTLEEAAELVAMDIREGAEAIIATPHYYVDEPSDPEVIRTRLEELRKYLAETGKGLFPDASGGNPADAGEEDRIQLYEGNEVLWFDSMTEKLQSGEILTLGGSRFTLIEFYPAESYSTILRAVRKVRTAGYRPIIAHAERFRGLRENGLSEVIDQGAYIQLSTEPFGGAFFDNTTRFVRDAAKRGECHFLGTDMHRPDRRAPKAAKGIAWIRKNCPDAEALLWDNADRMLDDEDFLYR